MPEDGGRGNPDNAGASPARGAPDISKNEDAGEPLGYGRPVSPTPRSPFPPEFRFGVATAAAQIESAADDDGRGPSVWDGFATRPGAIRDAESPGLGADHYRRLEEDLELLRDLGVDCYRFSVSWSRVLPEGVGAVAPKGLDFYERVVDGLLARGITPYLTLFHWDLPAALEVRGGFRNREIVGWFSEYTELLARTLGDRVRHFLTVNEPHAFIEGGLAHGRHAPGHRLPLSEVVRAGHHALLCHGEATRVLRATVRDSFVTAAPVLISATPATDSPEDLTAAREYTWSMPSEALRVSSWWMDPMYLGRYPESGLARLGAHLPRDFERDLERIHAPLDAVGMNLYDAAVVRAGRDGAPELVPPAAGSPRTAFGWPVTPDAHEYGPLFAYERYGKPVLITENGLSTRDWVHLDGRVHDPERVDFLHRHLDALGRALTRGVPVLGYLHWSLLDNFEWNHGYRERFGLVHVDFDTMRRTPKDSFFAYRERIRAERDAARRGLPT